jgi:hypothetical protein
LVALAVDKVLHLAESGAPPLNLERMLNER